MPPVKDVGEPCAGEPHARFDGRALETEQPGEGTAVPGPVAEKRHHDGLGGDHLCRSTATAPALDPTILTAPHDTCMPILTHFGTPRDVRLPRPIPRGRRASRASSKCYWTATGCSCSLERGLASSTVDVYVRSVRPFIASRQVGGALSLEMLTPGDVTVFVQSVNARRSPTTTALVMTALRSLLGFLHVTGLVPTALQAAVPVAVSWRLAGLPKSLTAGEVQRLLAACDRRARLGRRNYAMLLVLVRLGLRAGEVAALGLDDIDWRAGEIVVRGKGDRVERLPLPVDVGEAIAGYLRRGRPARRWTARCSSGSGHRIGPLRQRGVRCSRPSVAARAGLPAVSALIGSATRGDRDAARRGDARRGRPGAAAPARC